MREFRLFVRIDTQLFWHYIISQLPGLPKKIIWDDGSNNNRYDNGKILIILQLLLLYIFDYENIFMSIIV